MDCEELKNYIDYLEDDWFDDFFKMLYKLKFDQYMFLESYWKLGLDY